VTFTLAPQMALVFMLIFARIGAILMLMPALGERSIPSRLRLSFALALTFTLYPLLSARYGDVPATLGRLLILFGTELVIGLAIGFSMRLVLSALQVAGSAISMQLSLSFAESVDPTQGQHSMLLSNFLTVTAITLIFATDLDHVAIAGLVDSYQLFEPGRIPSVGDFSMMAIQTIAESFRIGVQIAAPFIVFGLVFQLGLGVLSRLMPQIQIYFIAMPASIALGFLVLFLLIGTIMTWYLGHVEAVFGRFVAP
jgi:flagellar biosynthetic protein FliR